MMLSIQILPRSGEVVRLYQVLYGRKRLESLDGVHHLIRESSEPNAGVLVKEESVVRVEKELRRRSSLMILTDSEK